LAHVSTYFVRCGNRFIHATILAFLFTFHIAGVKAQRALDIDSLKTMLAKERNDSLNAALDIEIGDQYVRRKIPQFDSAFIYYQKALDADGKRSESMRIDIRERIARLYLYTGNYPEALQISLDNLKAAEQIRDMRLIFFANRDIVAVYNETGDFSNALEVAKKLELLAPSVVPKKHGVDKGIFQRMAYLNVGNAYEGMNQFDSALRYTRLLYENAISAKDTEFLSLSTGTFAQLYNKLDMLDSALHYNKLFSFYAENANRPDHVTEAKGDRASLLEKKGQLDSALRLSLEYYGECKSRKDSGGIMKAAFLLSKIYRDRKQFDSAYTYLSYSNQIKDSLKTEDKIQKVQGLGFNELMQKKQLEQARREYRSTVKIYILLIGLALVVLFSFFLLRSNNQKHKAKLEVEKAYSELKAAQAQLIQAEKMASLGELTAGIAHEIQNPLNFVNNFSEVSNELLDEMKQELAMGNRQQASQIADDVKQNLEKIIHHGKRADGIVKGMLMHSRASSGQKELTDINVLADEYLRLSYHGLRAKDKTFQAKFETHFDKTIEKINVLPQDIGRVLLNLFTNAFYSVTKKNKQHPEGYEPCVSVTTKRLTNKIEIRVKDNGMGIPQKVMDKIFQPFFTTKPTGEGTGLGLSLSYDIITKGHGGELKAETKEGEFAEFIILLPDK
jgi:two-component system, NtrC family, sensor kinase